MDETPAMRIGDAERQQVIDLLRSAVTDGRITMDEFEERSGEAYAARTRGELDILLADLPPGVRPTQAHGPRPLAGGRAPGPMVGGAARIPGPVGPVGPVVGRPFRRRFVGIMSSSRARGRWHVPPEVKAFAFWGGVVIDLRDAVIETPVVVVRAVAIMGGVEVIVPEGYPVDLDGFLLMGGTTDTTRSVPRVEGAPLIRIKAAGMWGGVSVRNPSKRSMRRAAEAHGHGGRHGRGPEPDRPGGDDADDDVAADDDEASRHDPFAHMRHRWPVPPPIPGLPRSLDDVLPQMPGRSRPRVGVERRPAAPTPPSAPTPPTPSPAPAPTPAPASASANGGSPAASANGAQAAQAAAPDAAAPEAAGHVGGSQVRPTGRVLTMLVSDICDSTAAAVRLGDQRWMGVLAAHNALVREQLRRHHGTEVKAQGDGFLVTFTSARQAVLAGIAIQRAMAAHRRAYPDNDLHVRLGVHTGEVVEEEDDIFGQNVVVAVRIADVARPDEVLVSGLTRDLTESSGDLRFDAGREATLKGLTRPSRVYTAAWS